MNKTLPGYAFIDNWPTSNKPGADSHLSEISTAWPTWLFGAGGIGQPQAALTTAAQKVDQILSSGNSG